MGLLDNFPFYSPDNESNPDRPSGTSTTYGTAAHSHRARWWGGGGPKMTAFAARAR